MNNGISKIKVFMFVTIVTISALSVYFGLDNAFHESDRLRDIVSFCMSIFAASVITVISIVGDPKYLIPGKWHTIWYHKEMIRPLIVFLGILFVLYLIILVLIILVEVINEKLIIYVFVIKSLAFLSTFTILYSFLIPYILVRTRISGIDREMMHRKEKVTEND